MPLARKTKRGLANGSRFGGWRGTQSHTSAAGPLQQATMVEKSRQGCSLKTLRQKLDACTGKQNQVLWIGKVVELVYGFSVKPEQAEALWWLLYTKQDMLLVAKTSFGKSAVLQLLPLLVPDAAVLIILPLNAIGSEQVAKIQALPCAKPIHLKADNNHNNTLSDIRRGRYTHIFLSPEIACSLVFREKVLSNPEF